MYGCVGSPICCPPQYCVRNYYTPRVIPVIHPVVNVNRYNVVNVPQHIYQPMSTNVVVDPGQGYAGYGGYAGNVGYRNRLFF
ncbi:hypothetical protein DEAC_c42880 [Desulfosporosinus acididurans]|uniref:Spore coat protein D n=1 Tax=Desulfosporosinus acididurans TaxID=476652 RepID=A0A0J1IGE1_9FIRM|nr:spore coat protein D [Desulfosporosinus acididurans]KLU63796.1 hypothetical protein DEAC_c42880 [Desulfosporosinus acididurans]